MPFLRNIRPTFPKLFGKRKAYRRVQPLAPATTLAPAGENRPSARAIQRIGAFLRRKGPSVGGTALDVTETGLKIGGAVADLVPVPMLGVSLEAVSAIVQIAQTIRTNKADCRELAREVVEYAAILSQCEGERLDDGDLYALQELQDQLDLTLGVLKGIAAQALFAQLCYHQRNKDDLTRCGGRLAIAFRKYTLRNQMSSHAHRIQVLNAVQAVPLRVSRIMFTFFLIESVGRWKGPPHLDVV